MFVCVYMSMHICIYACVCVCVCVCVCIYIDMYTTARWTPSSHIGEKGVQIYIYINVYTDIHSY